MELFKAVAVVIIALGTAAQSLHTQKRFGKSLFPDTRIGQIFRPDSFRNSNSFKDAQRELINAPINVPRKTWKRPTGKHKSAPEPNVASASSGGRDSSYDQPQSDYYPSSNSGGYYGGRSSSPRSGYGYGSGSNGYVSPEYVPGAAGGGYGYPASGGGYAGSSGYGSKGYGGSNQGYDYGASGGYGYGSQGQGYSHGGDYSGSPSYSQRYPEEKSYSGGEMSYQITQGPRKNLEDVEIKVQYADGSPAKIIEDKDYGTSYVNDFQDVMNDFSRLNYDHYQPPPEVGEYPQWSPNSIGPNSVDTAADRFKNTVEPYMYWQNKLVSQSSMYDGPHNLIVPGKTHRQLPQNAVYGEMDARTVKEQAHPLAGHSNAQYESDNFHHGQKQGPYYDLPLEARSRRQYTQETFEPYRHNLDQTTGDIPHSSGILKKGYYHDNAHSSNSVRTLRYPSSSWQERSGQHSPHVERPYANSYLPREESQDTQSRYYAADNHDGSPPSYYTENNSHGPHYPNLEERDLYDQRSRGNFHRKQPSSHLSGKDNSYLDHNTKSKKSQGKVKRRYGIQYDIHPRDRNNAHNRHSNDHGDSASHYLTLKSPSYKAFNDYSNEEFSSIDHQGPSKATGSYISPRPISLNHVHTPVKEDLALLSTIYYMGSPKPPNQRDSKFNRDRFHPGEQRQAEEDRPVNSPMHQESPSLQTTAPRGYAKKTKKMMVGLPFVPRNRPHRGSLRDTFRSGHGMRAFPYNYQ